MKTPDEIKKGLETCIGKCTGNKPHCPYDTCGDGCMDSMNRDALAYIQQLERERDAAVEQMKNGYCCCHFCKHNRPPVGCAKEPILDRSCFEWCGVKENDDENHLYAD